ncbi:hypothetical protein A6V36_30390 [Paraburkholderia ginsengiterrae]|uniref:Fis family transcriptional regulator n=1 Tax=Paraburkholderia ginsengiterrae TaxID=1462993 RepID=A0A1A9N2T6_9BURK|nr:hypothetical protein [Paraburkholderia ginsengiterrae]OAJ55985.1 hypothetical protein A6V37_32230 [Paraburkholderia ginsengiterrae]OAJ58557.1 hypothetical protein A6V36_30390 [Paraburkholderia ginsengiterrae]
MKVCSGRLSAEAVTFLAVRCHLALQATYSSRGTASTAKTLFEVTVVAGILARRGHGDLTQRRAGAAEDAMKRAVRSGLDAGRWLIEDRDIPAMCSLISTFERQIAMVSAAELREAFKSARTLAVV